MKTRADGWPLCESCGEDELYSLAEPASVATIQGCYRCGPWKSPVVEALKHNHAKRTEAARNAADKQAVPALEKAQRALQISADE